MRVERLALVDRVLLIGEPRDERLQAIQPLLQLENPRVLLLDDVVEPLPAIVALETLIVDALGRLVDNGIKFSPDKGRVRIAAQSVDDWVELSVVDEGIGIAAKDHNRLFKRFSQLERYRREQQGVGIGLAIAQQIANLHGGEIVVESRPNEGSTFSLRLPKADLAGCT